MDDNEQSIVHLENAEYLLRWLLQFKDWGGTTLWKKSDEEIQSLMTVIEEYKMNHFT